jgi:HK97 family phage prohead protease
MKINNKIFSLTTTFKAVNNDDGTLTIRGMASTPDIDRVGDSISSDAWEKGGLDNFKKNPIILFNHNYDEPIGRATELSVTPNGLEMVANISSSASKFVGLIKDGVLGAFSVGFRIKDADYIEETDGLRIKDAELFEVSVVSVPCNQSATFSLAKSFDSNAEYEEFKKTFTNSVDLAGKLANEEANASSIASTTPEKTGISPTLEELNMNPEELQALLDKAAAKAVAASDMKRAEKEAAEKAVAEAEALKAAETAAIVTSVTSGTDLLLADIRKEFADSSKQTEDVIEQFKAELAEKSEELKAMRESKMNFSDRSQKGDVTAWGEDFMKAHFLGVMTGKGMSTDFARDIQEKAGIEYSASAADIDQEVSRLIEKEITLLLKTAGLFREIPVNGAATVLPIQPDVESATFQTGAAVAGNLENRGDADVTFKPQQVILNAYRLISQTYMDNHIDEEVLINLMPMLIDSVSRAHARAVDDAIINGAGSITGLGTFSEVSTTTLGIAAVDKLTALGLLETRKQMGKYGINPSDVAYIVSQARYFELIEDAGFADITDVGSNIATKLTGAIGAVYGSPVIVSDSFIAEANLGMCAIAVATRNYAIPRLRSVMLERDYEVGNQRNVVVATQSLGFEELVTTASGNVSSVRVGLVT